MRKGYLLKDDDPQDVANSTKSLPISQLKAWTKGRAWAFTDFELKDTVGKGTFSRVRVVKMKSSQERTPMVLKILRKADVIRLKQVEHVKAEKQIMSMVEHPFIVNLLGAFQDERRLFMLLEYVNGGELFSYLRREGRLPNDHVRFYSGEILLAFGYLHSLHVVYRDLKPENALLDFEGHIKLTDFGFAKVVEERTWTLCGTPEYLAPEMIQSKGHGKGVDWWALGVLLYEMLAGYPPFYDENPYGIYQKVLKGHVDFPRHFDVKAKDLIQRLLQQDRTKRLGCLKAGVEDVKKHKWYKGMDWDLLLTRSATPPFRPPVQSEDDTSMFDRYPESTEASAPAVSTKEQESFQEFDTTILGT
ncbi:PRKX [Symbiodinium natans]|uniref:PRKX protein n=1 Tax=Symbiodinium natans TaxID=878477 RepID=A0A812HVN1_9DINO|nr:PRKX [Symbiodinium natans]